MTLLKLTSISKKSPKKGKIGKKLIFKLIKSNLTLGPRRKERPRKTELMPLLRSTSSAQWTDTERR